MASAETVSRTFGYTGGEQTYTVPAGVSRVHVVAVGGHGGNASAPGGSAAQVSGELSVTPGETLYVEVGGNGAGNGGFNGGGYGYGGAGGGGGASDVRTSPLAAGLSPDDRLIVAGGGGGGGNTASGEEGTCASGAGGSAEEAGEESGCFATGGAPGTQSGGGMSGGDGGGAMPTMGQLGIGGDGGSDIYGGGGAAGGGGGYYGGGGGEADWGSGGAGGGGGSSLVPAGGTMALASANVQPQVQISSPPIAVTGAASAVARTSATLTATVNPGGSDITACHIEYGTSPSYGSSVPCSSLPGSGSSFVAVSALVTGLNVNTTYFYRIVATNGVGTGYGIEQTFNTMPNPPVVATVPASEVAQTLATLNGTVDPEGAHATACYFEYGTSPSYGSSVPCSSLPGSGSSFVAVSALVTGLSVNTTYFYRIAATNSGGTSYGSEGTLSTMVNTRAYAYTGGEQTFTVPARVLSVHVVAVGGHGGASPPLAGLAGAAGGVGAQVSGELSVTPGETLYVEVGGNGVEAGKGGGGGFNGGGNGARGGGGGGGASDVRTSPLAAGLSPDDRLIVAGAGGGAAGQGGNDYPSRPGANAGQGASGGPGTQSSGGEGGGWIIYPEDCEDGESGQLGVGGEAGDCPPNGGGGGGGYYGGGGGAAGEDVSGGGGGSSLVPTGGTVVLASTGVEPHVQISYHATPIPPADLTEPASERTASSATLNATVNPNGGEVSKCYFEYGRTGSYGSKVECAPSPGGGESPVPVSAMAEGLEANTVYHFRIVATNEGGTSYGEDQTLSTLPNAPSVTSVSPDAGLESGWTLVNISGTELSEATTVKFGSAIAIFTVDSSSEITATAPPGTGTVHVTVANPGGTSATGPADEFTYVAPGHAPTITKLSAKKGPAAGGTSATITGTGFIGVTAVKFGSTSVASFTVSEPECRQGHPCEESITTRSPAGTSGTVEVTVTTPNGESGITSEDRFKYEAPTVTNVSPNGGPKAGDTKVTVTGSGFAPGGGATTFTFGTGIATAVNCTSTTECTMASPATASKKAKTVDVRATVSGKTSKKHPPDDQYSYN